MQNILRAGTGQMIGGCLGGCGQGLSRGSLVPERIKCVHFCRIIGEGFQPVGGAGVVGEGVGGAGSHAAAEHLLDYCSWYPCSLTIRFQAVSRDRSEVLLW